VQALRQFHGVQGGEAALLSARVTDPFGYGRIVRHEDGSVNSIVEHKDASEDELGINEINAGLYIFKTAKLIEALGKLKTNNAKKEYYLTDTIHYLIHQGGKVHALMVPDATEVLGVNDREQLAEAHRLLNLRRVEEHQRNGVTFLSPATVEVSAETAIGQDSVIEGNVQLLGKTVIGEGCRVESGSYLKDAKLGKEVTIRSSRIIDSAIGDHSDAGPFAHVRGGSILDKNVHVGTGTELKNAKLASGSKAGHFSYIGDAQLGKDVNVGAGCVFANYDGNNKHHCKIGDKVFLGSNSTLVAPVVIGKGAVIGAGSVVTKDVAAGKTVVGVPAKVFTRKKG
jgi:bifunctional UDP-N-acetylglucosamine pyrophosphorylase/glucosamine-1-phosphate N-acetyltransferase